jgi:hypothetical protein
VSPSLINAFDPSGAVADAARMAQTPEFWKEAAAVARRTRHENA